MRISFLVNYKIPKDVSFMLTVSVLSGVNLIWIAMDPISGPGPTILIMYLDKYKASGPEIMP